MDTRVPKERKWSKSPSATCLLRQPSGKNLSVPRAIASAAVERSRTCPASKLTPQFHWNLNTAALKTLSKTQVEQLYGLFKFYDSSTSGDALPSINCTRLLEIVRDARLLNDSSSLGTSSTKGLQPEAVERIFAQAVMGKMRVYLDADSQPALTFPLFCGALMNCAMLVTPLARPEAALRQVLLLLLENSVVEGYHVSAAKGLLNHIPRDGSISLWTPNESQCPQPQTADAQQDFRELPAFHQVITDCKRARVLEEVDKEKLAQCYAIPDRLLASFHLDTIELISYKFRLFDVNDRGTLPRNEVFALLSCLGTQLDLPDPYTVLAKLSSLNSLPEGPESRTNPFSGSGRASRDELTLAQLLHIIEATREAKRHSATAQLGAMKIRMDRATSATTRNIPPTKAIGANGDNEHVVTNHKVPGHNRRTSTRSSAMVEHGRRHGIVGSKPHKFTVGQENADAGAVSSSHTGPGSNNHHVDSKTHHSSISSRKKTVVHHKQSLLVNGKHDISKTTGGDSRDREQFGEFALQSQRSNTSIYSSATKQSSARARGSISSSVDDRNGDCVEMSPATVRSGVEPNQGAQLQFLASAITIQMHEPPSVSNSKMIRIFLLLGGDHDGAICCTISLVFATKEILETEGVYFTSTPSETTRTTPVVPRQNSITNALRMLKRCILVKMERGFEQRPADQLEIVDNILQDLWNRQPHFSSSVGRTARGAPFTSRRAVDQGLVGTSHQRTVVAPRLISSAAPDRRTRSALPRQPTKTAQQVELPSNYRDLLATWEVSQSSNHSWIHDVNTVSPLKLAIPSHIQLKAFRGGHLSPLHLPYRQNNQIDITSRPANK